MAFDLDAYIIKIAKDSGQFVLATSPPPPPPPSPPPPPPPPTTGYFVSAAGSDSNSGDSASASWKTINKLNTHIFAPGDKIYLRGGDRFTGNFKPQIAGGGDAANRVIVDVYGSGRWTFNPTAGGFGQGIANIDGVSGVTIRNAIIAAPDPAIQPRGGIRFASNGTAGGWTLDRCEIWGIRFNSSVSADFGGCVFFEGCPGEVLLRNCDIHGEAGVNSRTDLGVGGFGGGHSHPGLVFGEGCLIYNIGSAGDQSKNGGRVYPPLGNGFSVDGAAGGVKLRYCIVHDCGANFNNPGAGPAAFLTHRTTGADIQFCEGYNVQPVTTDMWTTFGNDTTVDFIGVDLDNATTNGLVQHNYMHDNFNSGFMAFDRDGGWGSNAFSKNISVNNCKQGMTGFYELCIDAPGAQTWNDNLVYNDRAYAGQPYHNAQQGSGLISIKNAYATGTMSGNTAVIGQDIYGHYVPFNARDNMATSLHITGNKISPKSGGVFDSWWGSTEYFDIASWQSASGNSGNSIGTETTITLPTYALSLTSTERTLCAAALDAVANIAGMDHGNDSFNIPLPGSRAAALSTALKSADVAVNLPQFIVLGFALTRYDTPESTALLARLEPLIT